MDRRWDLGRNRTVQTQPRNETLPGSERSVHANRMHVDTMFRTDDFGWTNRRGFRWHLGQIATHAEASVKRILRDGVGAQRNDSRPHLPPLIQFRCILRAIRFNKRQMSRPARPTVAAIRTAQIRDASRPSWI